MQGTDKVLLIGDNGCGKTTLLRRLAQNLLARDDIRAAYMPQRYEETMDEDQSAIAYLHTRGDKEQLTRLRTYLGAFKFSTEEMEHPIRSLSGGQKAKLFFLRMILEDANVLLLDEPTRNLLLRITDPALLSATGGIVQGMSGSPILQNGRIVGAVTHVLLNDPTRGYGIFIENMLDMAG